MWGRKSEERPPPPHPNHPARRRALPGKAAARRSKKEPTSCRLQEAAGSNPQPRRAAMNAAPTNLRDDSDRNRRWCQPKLHDRPRDRSEAGSAELQLSYDPRAAPTAFVSPVFPATASNQETIASTHKESDGVPPHFTNPRLKTIIPRPDLR